MKILRSKNVPAAAVKFQEINIYPIYFENYLSNKNLRQQSNKMRRINTL